MNSPLGFLLKERGTKWERDDVTHTKIPKQQLQAGVWNYYLYTWSWNQIQSKKANNFQHGFFEEEGATRFYPITSMWNYIQLEMQLHGLEKTAQNVNTMRSSQQGSLLSAWFILNNNGTKPHYKHTHFITHTHTKSPSPRTVLQRMTSLCDKGLYCTLNEGLRIFELLECYMWFFTTWRIENENTTPYSEEKENKTKQNKMEKNHKQGKLSNLLSVC